MRKKGTKNGRWYLPGNVAVSYPNKPKLSNREWRKISSTRTPFGPKIKNKFKPYKAPKIKRRNA